MPPGCHSPFPTTSPKPGLNSVKRNLPLLYVYSMRHDHRPRFKEGKLQLADILAVLLLFAPAVAGTHAIDREKTAAPLAAEAKNRIAAPPLSTVHASIVQT